MNGTGKTLVNAFEAILGRIVSEGIEALMADEGLG